MWERRRREIDTLILQLSLVTVSLLVGGGVEGHGPAPNELLVSLKDEMSALRGQLDDLQRTAKDNREAAGKEH